MIGKTLIVAGATGYGAWPANTLEGARRCLAEPIDGFEIDVQLTADGHVVAHHDYRLDPDATRLDGSWLDEPSAPLKAMTLADLRRFDVGALRPGSKTEARHPGRAMLDGAQIPTLPELLATLREIGEPRRLIYVEIKTDPTRPHLAPEPEPVTRAVLADLDAAGWTDRAKIIAFDWRVLRLAKAVEPAIATAHLTIPPALAANVKPLADGSSPWTDGADAASHGGSELAAIRAHGGEEWSPHLVDISAARVAEAAALGLRVGPWGVSAAADIARMAELDVFSATISGPAWGV